MLSQEPSDLFIPPEIELATPNPDGEITISYGIESESFTSEDTLTLHIKYTLNDYIDPELSKGLFFLILLHGFNFTGKYDVVQGSHVAKITSRNSGVLLERPNLEEGVYSSEAIYELKVSNNIEDAISNTNPGRFQDSVEQIAREEEGIFRKRQFKRVSGIERVASMHAHAHPSFTLYVFNETPDGKNRLIKMHETEYLLCPDGKYRTYNEFLGVE